MGAAVRAPKNVLIGDVSNYTVKRKFREMHGLMRRSRNSPKLGRGFFFQDLPCGKNRYNQRGLRGSNSRTIGFWIYITSRKGLQPFRHCNNASDSSSIISAYSLAGEVVCHCLGTDPNNMPPKATKSPTAMAVTEDPGVPSGFIIPMDRKLIFCENIL